MAGLLLLLVAAPSSEAEQAGQCTWFPATCKAGVVVTHADRACFGVTPCDEFGREYTDATWPKTKADLDRACKRYVAQHGFAIDEICEEPEE